MNTWCLNIRTLILQVWELWNLSLNAFLFSSGTISDPASRCTIVNVIAQADKNTYNGTCIRRSLAITSPLSVLKFCVLKWVHGSYLRTLKKHQGWVNFVFCKWYIKSSLLWKQRDFGYETREARNRVLAEVRGVYVSGEVEGISYLKRALPSTGAARVMRLTLPSTSRGQVESSTFPRAPVILAA